MQEAPLSSRSPPILDPRVRRTHTSAHGHSLSRGNAYRQPGRYYPSRPRGLEGRRRHCLRGYAPYSQAAQPFPDPQAPSVLPRERRIQGGRSHPRAFGPGEDGGVLQRRGHAGAFRPGSRSRAPRARERALGQPFAGTFGLRRFDLRGGDGRPVLPFRRLPFPEGGQAEGEGSRAHAARRMLRSL